MEGATELPFDLELFLISLGALQNISTSNIRVVREIER
jgi:hypothetical protein